MGSPRPEDKSRGRPCSLNAQRHEQIVQAFAAGLPQRNCARAGGISPRQLGEWLRRGRKESRGKFRELFEAVELAKRESIAKLVGVIVAATGPQVTRTTKTVTEADGSVRTESTEVTAPGKWQPALALLERRFPEDFALRVIGDLRDLVEDLKLTRKLATGRKLTPEERFAMDEEAKALTETPTEGDAQP